MQASQRRRERENRQINKRLRTLIAAYKILGGSFTGELSVDPAHLRSMRPASSNMSLGIEPIDGTTEIESTFEPTTSERRRRLRDAVEAALSDVILSGTEEQANLAAHAAREMVAGNKVHLSTLIVTLRNFIRNALDLELISTELLIPHQGPLRPVVSSGKDRGGVAVFELGDLCDGFVHHLRILQRRAEWTAPVMNSFFFLVNFQWRL